MACIPKDTTAERAARAVLEEEVYGELKKLGDKATQEDRMKVFDKIDEKYQGKIIVKGSELPVWKKNQLGLRDEDTTELYSGLLGRTTHAVRAKLVHMKGPDAVREMSELPDNALKAETGTRIHGAMEHLMELKIAQGNYSHIMGNKKQFIESRQKIGDAFNIGTVHMTRLEQYVEKLLGKINDHQRNKIDSNGKVKIYTERFIPDYIHNTAGTVDVMALYSDGKSSVYDFKSMYPWFNKQNWDATKKIYRLDDDDWIPAYKINDINVQLGANKNIIQSKNLSTEVMHNRAIPIVVAMTYLKDKNREDGHKLSDKIFSLSIGEDMDSALGMIPVQEKLEGPLGKHLSALRNIEHNQELIIAGEKSPTPRKLTAMKKLKRIRRSINKLIVDRDLNTLITEVKGLLNNYYQKTGVLKEIDNIDSPDYLSLAELQELKEELVTYRGIVASSGQFLAELSEGQGEAPDKKLQAKYLGTSDMLSGVLDRTITSLGEIIVNRVMDSKQRGAIQDYTSVGFGTAWFRTRRQQNHPAFRVANEAIDMAENRARLETQDFLKSLLEHKKILEGYAKEHGLTNIQLMNKFIYDRSDKAIIHGKYTNELYKEIREAKSRKDTKKLRELLELRPDAEERRAAFKENYIDLFASDPDNPQANEAKIKKWEADNSFENAILGHKSSKWYFQPRDLPQYYTDGYKEIASDKRLLDFWNFWQDTMAQLNDKLDFSEFEYLPHNFLPYLRSDVLDMFMHGTLSFGSSIEYAKSLFGTRNDDIIQGMIPIKGKINPETGEAKRQIPIVGMHPLMNKKGERDSKLQSRNIFDSLYTFVESVTRYAHLKNDVEPMIEALQDIIAMEGEKMVDERGKEKGDSSGTAQRLRGTHLSTLDQFKKHMSAHVHGYRIQDFDKKTAKTALQLKKYHTIKELGLAVLAPLGNFIQVRTNAYFDGLNGYFYSSKQLNQTQKMSMGSKTERALYNALRHLFAFNADHTTVVKRRKLSASGIQEWLNLDTMMLGYRWGEHALTSNVGITLLRNYGIDENGNLERLAVLPKGTKSLFDRIDRNAFEKENRIVIEGLVDKKGDMNLELYTSIRNLAQGVSRQIKGGMNREDLIGADTSLIWSLAMSFRRWMPGMIDNRTGGIRYDSSLNAVVEGKFKAMLTDMGFFSGDPNRQLSEILTESLLPSIGKLLLDIGTFGWLFKSGTRYKVNEQRARDLFEAYKQKYKNDPDIQRMKFENFLDYKQGQMRSAAAELFAVLSIAMLVMHLGGKGDDGERRWRNSWFGRSSYRLLNRARREISFMFSTDDWTRTFAGQLVPLTSLIFDVQRWARNFRDEIGDIIYGEEEERQGMPGFLLGHNRGWRQDKPAFYESLRFVPGHKLIKTLEVFERDQEAEY